MRIITKSCKLNGHEMRSEITFLVIALCVTVASIDEAAAAEIRRQASYYVIEGEIENGDFDKFEALVRLRGMFVHSVAIGSPGGDMMEAMRIGRLVREMRLSTSSALMMVPGKKTKSLFIKDLSNDICASSCFYIFIAGIDRFGHVLGIHRPYLSDEDYKRMNIDDAIEASKFLKTMVKDYFVEMGVSTDYVDRAFSISSNEIEWLKRDEIEKYFFGLIPEIDEWVSARCPKLTEAEALIYGDDYVGSWETMSVVEKKLFKQASDKSFQISKCKWGEMDVMSCRAWDKKYNERDSYPYPCELQGYTN